MYGSVCVFVCAYLNQTAYHHVAHSCSFDRVLFRGFSHRFPLRVYAKPLNPLDINITIFKLFCSIVRLKAFKNNILCTAQQRQWFQMVSIRLARHPDNIETSSNAMRCYSSSTVASVPWLTESPGSRKASWNFRDLDKFGAILIDFGNG